MFVTPLLAGMSQPVVGLVFVKRPVARNSHLMTGKEEAGTLFFVFLSSKRDSMGAFPFPPTFQALIWAIAKHALKASHPPNQFGHSSWQKSI